MSISSDIRKQVRVRANFACEFCGVTETDAGGGLTIDHFQPKSKGGLDNLVNLVYCCVRCNNYKFNYFPTRPTEPKLWNPRIETAAKHFILSDSGQLQPLTEIGHFTIIRLRLNRAALIKHRIQKQEQAQQQKTLEQYAELLNMQHQLNQQISTLVQEQNNLLQTYQHLLRILIKKK